MEKTVENKASNFDVDYIDRIGVEIEGFFSEVPQAWHCGKFVLDGSVEPSDDEESEYPYIGEVVSSPMYVHKIDDWIKRWYPSSSNCTCGLHVHISLKDERLYEALRTVDFYDFYRLELEKFIGTLDYHDNQDIRSRYRGYNEYCPPIPIEKFDYITREQMLATTKIDHRYHDLNFCRELHGTIECRVFPVFYDACTAINAVHWFVNTVNRYLINVEIAKASIQSALRKRIVRDGQVIADISLTRAGDDLVLNLKSEYIENLISNIPDQVLYRPQGGKWAYYAKMPEIFELARECRYDADLDSVCSLYSYDMACDKINLTFFFVHDISQGREFRCLNDITADKILYWIDRVENWFEKYI